MNGDSTQLHQVLLNLCVNARDAINGSGVMAITAENLKLEGVISRWKREPVTGPHVRLTVSDTGHGIPSEVMEKLFHPFFTTKEIGKGTGLGLSTVMGIVKHHGGFVDVLSKGRGEPLLGVPASRGCE